LSTAGTSINLLWPFSLTLVIAIFGVLMGAGGGFILNPILVSIFPALPHTIVAGTVMPTVLFAQGSGIYNYSKIKFINWKLGIGIGCAMLLGGFIGPKLTELITLDQFKFAFGWILLVLSGLMYWQTTPGYLEKNKKEQAILKEFKKRAEECAKRGEEGTAACPTDKK
ncbi:MAG: sulfite exporter TauE/SafE family protein, partial [Desulfobulbaceae bacterium]|nr:sulfite exporter TauE/SafE family protein [Desulfobulbaceae bacterium]